MNVRDQIPPRIIVPGPGPVCHVGRKALSSCQPWALSNQEHDDQRVENFADIVEHAHPAMANEKRLAEAPSAATGRRCEMRQQGRNLGSHRRSGKSIGDGHLDIGLWRTPKGQFASPRRVNRASCVGPKQKIAFVARQRGDSRKGPIRRRIPAPKSAMRSNSRATASLAAAWSRRSSSQVAVR